MAAIAAEEELDFIKVDFADGVLPEKDLIFPSPVAVETGRGTGVEVPLCGLDPGCMIFCLEGAMVDETLPVREEGAEEGGERAVFRPRLSKTAVGNLISTKAGLGATIAGTTGGGGGGGGVGVERGGGGASTA